MLHFEMYKEGSSEDRLESNSQGFLYMFPERPLILTKKKGYFGSTKYLDEATDE
jgi:hypothetical protein